ncbi:MAG: TMEM143 family protein [Hyphomicrobiaceae bacterium]
MVAAAISTTAREVELVAADPHSAAALQREKFLPVTRSALMDRLTVSSAWPSGDVKQVRRFLRYLDYWRRHSYTMRLLELEHSYEPFSPDSDLLTTRKFSAEERTTLRKRLVGQISEFLEQANFTRVDPAEVHVILTKDSHYGLDLHVDLAAFEEILIFYRGATTITERRRDPLKAYIGWKEVKIPVFQRLFLLFKLKPFEERVREVMQEQKIDRNDAERQVKRMRAMLPAAVNSDYVYLKLFKNLPRSDVEMIFPNTKVKFRLFDKIKFGVTAGGGLGMGVFGTASKIALLTTNPIAFAGALVGLGGVAARQASNFVAQRNRYMVVMAQNLYFHAMADNRGVVTLLADRAAEEDVKEEMLLYSVLAKAPANIADLGHLDQAIEQYLARTFNIDVDFDVSDALRRLKEDGIVSQLPDGTLQALPPHQAALRIDQLWDASLDQLPDIAPEEGREMGMESGDTPTA